MKFSIVTTMYYSAPYIKEFYERISNSVKNITDDYEIIFVNDGSPDNSLEIVTGLLDKDDKIKIIDLSRNFGHHKAIMTGITHTKGEYIFVIDCDLEEEPEFLEKFWNELKASRDTDVIFGVQEKRKGGIFERYSGNLFYKIFNFISEFKVPENLLIARIMTRRYVDNLIKHTENDVIFMGICALTGFKQKSLYVKKHHKGSTTYTLHKKISMLVNAITSFSAKPLVYIFYLGFIIFFVSSLAAIWLIFRKLYYGLLAGWTSMIVSIWLFGGINLCCLGIIGIYLEKIFKQSKNRPFTIIKQIYEKIDRKQTS